MLEEFLIEIGLSEKEAAIYLMLLQVEHASVAEIAQKSKINRTTVYPVLETLIQKLLVEEVEIKSKTRYRAFSPDRLETYIQTQQIQLAEQAHRANDMIPRFKSRMHREGRPVVEYREGKKAILDMSRDFYTEVEEGQVLMSIFSRDLIENRFSKRELEQAKNSRLSFDVPMQSFLISEKKDFTTKKSNKMIVVNKKKYPIPGEIAVLGDRIRMYSFGETPVALVVKNKDIAETLRTLFKIAFDNWPKK